MTRHLVLPLSKEEVISVLEMSTKRLKRPPSTFLRALQPSEDFLFQGWVGEETFRVSIYSIYPHNFVPLISGRVDQSSTGSIVSIKFSLFHGTAVIFMAAMIISLLVALFFLLIHNRMGIGLGALVFGAVNYVVALGNFNMHYKQSVERLIKILDLSSW